MKRKISLLLVLSMLLALHVPASSEILKGDVKGHWAEKEISTLLFGGMASGYPDGEFKPNNNINVDEFVAIVVRALGFELEANENDWSKPFIDKATEEGFLTEDIVGGYARPITREEMCSIITLAFGVEEEEENIFAPSDEDKISTVFSDAVRLAYNAKIVSGYEDGSFRPDANLTRAEACRVIVAANEYDPDAKLPFEKKVYYPFEAGEDSPWSFYTTTTSNKLRSGYTEMSVYPGEGTGVVSVDGKYSMPHLSWENPTTENPLIYIRPEGDAKVKTGTGKGQIVLAFTAPRGGSYEFDFEAQNIGTDVLGGDGVTATFTFYGENNNYDATIIESFVIGFSKAELETYSFKEVIKLKRGQTVALRLDANIDGYGDKLKTRYSVSTTQEEGTTYVNNGLYGLLATPPSEKQNSSAPYREGLVWFGIYGPFAAGQYADEAWDTVRKYVPNVGLALNIPKPELIADAADYYRENDVPIFIQRFGDPDLYTYYDKMDAWERNWDGTKADSTASKNGVRLAGAGHAAAITHSAKHDWAERMMRSAARNGLGGFGFIDLVWFYSFGVGRAVFNPETIANFRKDLKGEDEGLMLEFNSDEPRLWHFEDYAKYYIGAMLEPADLGLGSWDEYTPISQAEFLKNPDKDYTQWDLLVSMLMSYEYLRYAQHIANVGDEEGGTSQILPNPEDAGNAVDGLFLHSISGLDLFTDEFFRDPWYLDGCYYRYDYLMSQKSDSCSSGIVLECGTGGNQGTYYDIPIAYLIAYEVGAATDTTHVEVDFFVQNQAPIEKNAENWKFKDRYQCGMSYAMGWNAAQEDNLKKVDADFVAVSSRRVNRPWGDVYGVWEWGQKYRGTAELLLSKNGYIFSGIAEDGIMNIDPNQKFLLYCPDRPTKYHFDYVKDNLEKGGFENILSNAVCLRAVVDQKFRQLDMGEVYPEYDFEEKTEQKLSGNVTDKNGNVIAEDIEIESTAVWSHPEWETVLSVGDTPVLARRTFGEGNMYMYLLDPNEEVNYQLSKAVYDYVLAEMEIEKHFETVETYGEYLDGYTLREKLTDMGDFEENASVRLYENGDLKVVGVQSPYARWHCDKVDTYENTSVAYELKNAKTTVKARLNPNTEYSYIAMPSGVKGTTVSDENGFAELSFENTSHEIFYCLPKSAENDARISKIAERILLWQDSVT